MKSKLSPSGWLMGAGDLCCGIPKSGLFISIGVKLALLKRGEMFFIFSVVMMVFVYFSRTRSHLSKREEKAVALTSCLYSFWSNLESKWPNLTLVASSSFERY
jgi:hypothetical protein